MSFTHAVPATTEKPQTEFKPFEAKTFLPPESKIEPPVSVYKEIRGVPYAANYFGVSPRELDFSPLLGAKLETINKFVLDKISNERLKDDFQTYNAVLGDLKWKLKISLLEKDISVLDKLYKYISRRGKSAYKK